MTAADTENAEQEYVATPFAPGSYGARREALAKHLALNAPKDIPAPWEAHIGFGDDDLGVSALLSYADVVLESAAVTLTLDAEDTGTDIPDAEETKKIWSNVLVQAGMKVEKDEDALKAFWHKTFCECAGDNDDMVDVTVKTVRIPNAAALATAIEMLVAKIAEYRPAPASEAPAP
jgi:hypothetical protein